MEKKDIKKVELDILIEIKRICDFYNIEFFLIGGSFLGAIRHKGFISWDDDIDIGMTRGNYEKFIQVSSKEFTGKIKVQNYYSDNTYPLSFLKVLNTAYKVKENRSRNKDSLNGIFVDVFPFDRMPKSTIRRKIQIFRFKFLNSYIEYELGWRSKNFKNEMISFLINIFSNKKITFFVKKRDKIMREYNKQKKFDYYNIPSQYGPEKEVIKEKEMNKMKQITFENIKLNIPEAYDKILTRQYGNYMIPPKPEERNAKHLNLK
ncbi:LicD family protein [Pediococcus pentosaceus]|uniref:LicD family protein n=1 Tax=Pediococcus pentosaceus TaxID=1255 RepID=UPI0018A15969|nr:LicD family protein [Pediococcus pentosaceus]MBF7102886.1 LicD family protein [Pediococcus pentosaceus]